MDAAGEALLELLGRGEVVRLRARGQSMRPLLPDGTEVWLAPLGPAGLVRVGDVVLARVGGGLVLHRVVALRPGQDRGVSLRGDGRRTADPPVGREALVGKVVAARRFGRRLRLDGVLGRTLGLLAAQFLPLLWRVRR